MDQKLGIAPHSAHVAIIGGGVAGLAAAVTLAHAGIKPTLFEAGIQLGGRARRVDYKGLKLDNGQHILLGAYHETLRLLKLAGVDENSVLVRQPLQWRMLDLTDGNRFSLNTYPALPAPLHILAGLLCAQGLSLSDKLSAIKLMLGLQLKKFRLPQDEPLAEFLRRNKQSEFLIKNLWEPLCLAALNTPLAIAGTQVFLHVIRDSFTQQKSASDLLLPRVDLSQLIAEPLAAYIGKQGGILKTGCAVKRIRRTDDGWMLTTGSAEEQFFSHVIVACAPHQLDKLSFEGIDPPQHAKFNYQPITTIYLQYAETTQLPQVMTGLVGTHSQWVFDRGLLCGQQGLLAVVISANTALYGKTQNELAEIVKAELKAAFPHIGEVIWHKVITEKRATFSCDAHLVRPEAITGERNLYWAGDYVAGDYPATIEGAARSGVHCARLLLAGEG